MDEEAWWSYLKHRSQVTNELETSIASAASNREAAALFLKWLNDRYLEEPNEGGYLMVWEMDMRPYIDRAHSYALLAQIGELVQ